MTAKNAAINIKHTDDGVALNNTPIPVELSRQHICLGSAEAIGCIFYREGYCHGDTQEAYDKVVEYVPAANRAFNRLKGSVRIGMNEEMTKMWRKCHIIARMARDVLLPLGTYKNGTISVNCPKGIYAGDIFPSDDTA